MYITLPYCYAIPQVMPHAIPQTDPSFTLTVFLVMMSVALSAEFQCSRRQQR